MLSRQAESLDQYDEDMGDHSMVIIEPPSTNNRIIMQYSFFSVTPMGMKDILRRIKSKGYFPVLAHPERYVYMDKDDYRELKSMEILFQVNLSSLAGGYGPEAEDKSHWLLKKGFYDLAGSDLHSLRNTQFWSKPLRESVINPLRKILASSI